MAFEASGRTVVATGGNPGGVTPQPRKPRRRRMSRRRFYRRVTGGVVVVALLIAGTGPTLHFLGYRARETTRVTMQWDVVRVAADRRSVDIQVDECGGDYDSTKVMRVGDNVRLAVSVDDDVDDRIVCAPFSKMPVYVVPLGFALPADGHVIASGCPKSECGEPGPS